MQKDEQVQSKEKVDSVKILNINNPNLIWNEYVKGKKISSQTAENWNGLKIML